MKTRTELENELNLLESGAAAIREQLAAMPKQWEPDGGDFYVSISGDIGSYHSTPHAKLFGVERKTREAAERAAIEMRKFNRLLAYRDEFAAGYKPDWNDEDDLKFSVAISKKSWEWITWSTKVFETPGDVYMPCDVAIELCRKLNSGEVVL